MRRAAKVDQNQSQIVRALRDAGASVLDLSGVGNGCPDLLVAFRGQMFLIEIKNPMRLWQYTKDQLEFHGIWNSPIYTVTTVEGAFAVIGIEVKWEGQRL